MAASISIEEPRTGWVGAAEAGMVDVDFDRDTEGVLLLIYSAEP
jgi:hypothetical protein